MHIERETAKIPEFVRGKDEGLWSTGQLCPDHAGRSSRSCAWCLHDERRAREAAFAGDRLDRGSLLSLVKSGTWLDSQEFPPLQWAVPGVIPEGMGVLAGSPKAGKSWLALALLLGVAEGSTALGIECEGQRDALYLALEDGDRRLQVRARSLLDGRPIPAGFHYVLRVPAADVARLVSEWLTGHAGGLVVVDTFAKVRGSGTSVESAYERDYRQAGALKTVADDHSGSTVLLVHHTRKMAATDFLESVSGTNGITGAADFVAVLTRERTETTGLLSITGRDVPEAEYALVQPHVGCWELAGGDLDEAQAQAQAMKAVSGLGNRSGRIVQLVSEHPEGVSPRQVADTLDMSNDDAGRYMRRAHEAGRIERAERGLYRPVRSVRASEDSAGDGTPALGHSDDSDAWPLNGGEDE